MILFKSHGFVKNPLVHHNVPVHETIENNRMLDEDKRKVIP